MTRSALAFHAAPPKDHWVNDPNGLVHIAGAWRLFVQHRADAPTFRATGWARFSSADLLRWRFDGAVIPPQDSCWNYSGSLIESGRLIATHTRHCDGLEDQVERTSDDGGATWSEPRNIPSLGIPSRNRRDPYIFERDGAWSLLLAEPCDWTDWASQPPSQIACYRSADRLNWQWTGTIGPFDPPGIMWEVPVLASIDGYDVLLVSKVDRRNGGVDCWVDSWIGVFAEGHFEPYTGTIGRRIDLGFDFYAAMMATGYEEPLLIGWGSNWRTARTFPWPGFAGGPISLPRSLTIETIDGWPRLRTRLPASTIDRFTEVSSQVSSAGLGIAQVPFDQPLTLEFASTQASVRVSVDPVQRHAEIYRAGSADLDAAARFDDVFEPMLSCRLLIAIDGPMIEIFFDEPGVAISVALPTNGMPMTVSLASDAAIPIEWRTLTPTEA